MNKKIYFVRHGKSLGNVANALHEAAESELHEEGHIQAGKVVNRLSRVEFETIVASDYKRTQQTAENIVSVIKQDISFNELFRERGEHESTSELVERVVKGRQYLESLEVKRALVVGHGQWIKMFLTCLVHGDNPTEEQYEFMHEFFRIVNTGVCVFNHNTEGEYVGWQLKSWNEHGHLE